MMLILSAYRADLPVERNEERHARMRATLDALGVEYQETVGAFEGAPERGFAVEPRDPDPVRQLAATFGQRCVLVVANGLAVLHWLDFYGGVIRREPLGPWREVSEAEAKAAPAWTAYGGRWYVAG